MMNQNYKELLATTAGIVETARKNAGFTQGELADKIGVIQSTISRIEKGILSPTLYHWLEMGKILKIPEEAVNIGYLDRCSITKINSEAKEGGFTLPAAYRPLKCMKVRGILAHLTFIEEKFGKEFLKKIFLDLKMKPTFFLNLDNHVNFNLTEDILEIVGKYHKIDGRTQGGIVSYAASEKVHGVLARFYRNASDQLDLVERYLKNISKYHRVFCVSKYKIENGQITFDAQYPLEIQKFFNKLGHERDQFLWEFYLSWIKKFSLFNYKNKIDTHKEVHIESTGRDKHGIRHVTITTC